MLRPILFVCSGGCLILGALFVSVGVGFIIFTQISPSSISLITAGGVFLGLAGLFFVLMIQEEEEEKMKGKIYWLPSLFFVIFSFLAGMLWVHFIMHPPVTNGIIPLWFYKNYWWTVFFSSLTGLALAFYFWQKSVRKEGLHF